MLNADDKCSFYNLLERKLREPHFLAKVLTSFRGRDSITEDVAVDSIFLLVDEILVIHEYVAELEKIPNKYTRYADIKYLVTETARLISMHMKFESDGNLTRQSIAVLTEILDSYTRSIKTSRDANKLKLKKFVKN